MQRRACWGGLKRIFNGKTVARRLPSDTLRLVTGGKAEESVEVMMLVKRVMKQVAGLIQENHNTSLNSNM